MLLLFIFGLQTLWELDFPFDPQTHKQFAEGATATEEYQGLWLRRFRNICLVPVPAGQLDIDGFCGRIRVCLLTRLAPKMTRKMNSEKGVPSNVSKVSLRLPPQKQANWGSLE